MYEFKNGDWAIETSGEPVSLSYEYVEGEYVIQNDKPIAMRIPLLKGKKSAELRLYQDGKWVATRQGVFNKSNPEQLEFRLTKAYQKAVIAFKD